MFVVFQHEFIFSTLEMSRILPPNVQYCWKYLSCGISLQTKVFKDLFDFVEPMYMWINDSQLLHFYVSWVFEKPDI